MRIYVMFFMLIIAASCENRKHEREYYPDGSVKIDAEVFSGERDGLTTEYFESGKVKSQQYWKNGKMEGSFVDYFENGNAYRKGLIQNDKMVHVMYFYESGDTMLIEEHDSMGAVSSVRRFKEGGTRDSLAYPVMFMSTFNDTLQVGVEAKLILKIVNVIDSIYYNGELIISNGFSDHNQAFVKVSDTVDLIKPTNNFDYLYQFTPEKIGRDTIFGQFIFQKESKFETVITTIEFEYPYLTIPSTGRKRPKLARIL